MVNVIRATSLRSGAYRVLAITCLSFIYQVTKPVLPRLPWLVLYPVSPIRLDDPSTRQVYWVTLEEP
jgi:hypothetical protein